MRRKKKFTTESTENTESTEAISVNSVLSVVNTNDIPADFQMTELGPLPKEWRVVRLGEVFDITQGKSLSAKQNKGVRPRPFLRTSNVYWGYLDLSKLDLMDFTEEEEQKFALQPGDLLVCEGGDVGRTAMWEGQMQGVYYQNHIHRLRASDNNVNPVFVMYWLQTAFTLLNLYSGSSNKTTIPNLSQGRLAVFPIPLPPLDEQRAIAHVLRTVQGAKEATERVIAALRELKKSLMRHLFTCGPVPLDAAGNVELQETEIGPIPAHWRVVRLGEVCKFQGGTQPPKKEFVYRPQPGYVRLLQIRDFESDKNAVFVKFRKGLRLVEKDDVLIARYGASVGKILRGKAGAINVAIVKTIPDKEKIAKNFLYYRLDFSDFQSFVKGLGGRAAQAGFNKGELNTFLLPLPPLDEQREIARTLQAVDAKIAAEGARRAALEELFKTLLHQLMTGKIRVRGLIPTTVDSAESTATED